MAARFILVLTAVLMVVGCGECMKKATLDETCPAKASAASTVKKEAQTKLVVIEAENFTLTNAEVQDLAEASGGKVIILQDENSKAETTVKLSKGEYVVTAYVLGASEDEDAFYIAIGGESPVRSYPTEPGELQPMRNDVYYTHPDCGPCKVVLTYGEPNVQIDRVEIKRIN